MNAQDSAQRLHLETWPQQQFDNAVPVEIVVPQAFAPDRGRAAALHQMGIAAFQAGRSEQAISCMQQAAKADPGSPHNFNAIGVFYAAGGEPSKSVAFYKHALQLQPDFAAAASNLALALYRLGECEEAAAFAEQALRSQPAFPQAHNHLGLALTGLAKPVEAAKQFQMALDLQPDFAEAHLNLGIAQIEQGKLAEGLSSYQQALRLRPDFADAHMVMADLFKMVGRFEDAVNHLREALLIKADLGLAYCNLSEFAMQGLCRFSGEELQRLRGLLYPTPPDLAHKPEAQAKDPSSLALQACVPFTTASSITSSRLSLLDRSLMHTAMANLNDSEADYDAAFADYSKGNALRKEWLRQNEQDFDPAAHHRLIGRLMATFEEPSFRQRHPASSDSDLPLFVVGMPRSGTTLVEQILSSHSKVAGAGELADLARLLKSLTAIEKNSGRRQVCMQFEEDVELRAVVNRYLTRLAGLHGPKALRVVDKMPENFLYLGVIALAFPRARVIHCRRDPLDSCLSCFKQNFKGVNYSWSLEDLGLYYREYEHLMAHWKKVLPLQMMEVSYEDLIAKQESVSRQLVEFCGLEWEDSCLAFHNNPRPVQTASAIQVRRPIYTSSIGRWKKYAAHLEPLRRALGMGPYQPEA